MNFAGQPSLLKIMKKLSIDSIEGFSKVHKSYIQVPALLSGFLYQLSKGQDTINSTSTTAMPRLRLRVYLLC